VILEVDRVSATAVHTNFSNVTDLNTGNYEFTFEALSRRWRHRRDRSDASGRQLAEGSYDVAQGDVSRLLSNSTRSPKGPSSSATKRTTTTRRTSALLLTTTTPTAKSFSTSTRSPLVTLLNERRSSPPKATTMATLREPGAAPCSGSRQPPRHGRLRHLREPDEPLDPTTRRCGRDR